LHTLPFLRDSAGRGDKSGDKEGWREGGRRLGEERSFVMGEKAPYLLLEGSKGFKSGTHPFQDLLVKDLHDPALDKHPNHPP